MALPAFFVQVVDSKGLCTRGTILLVSMIVRITGKCLQQLNVHRDGVTDSGCEALLLTSGHRKKKTNGPNQTTCFTHKHRSPQTTERAYMYRQLGA